MLKLLRSKLVVEETDSTTGIDMIHRQVDRQIGGQIDSGIDREMIAQIERQLLTFKKNNAKVIEVKIGY